MRTVKKLMCHQVWCVCVLALAGCATAPRPAPLEHRTRPVSEPAAAKSPAPTANASVSAPEKTVRPVRNLDPDQRPSQYTVVKGDTLYSIALDAGLDYRELAQWNGLEDVNLIKVGQTLRLTAPDMTPPPAVGVQVGKIERTPLTEVATLPEASGSAAAKASEAVALPTYTEPKPSKKPWSEGAQAQGAAADKAKGADKNLTPEKPVVVPDPKAVEVKNTAVAGVPEPKASANADDEEGMSWALPTAGKIAGRFGEAGGKGVDFAGRSGQSILASGSGKVVYAGSGLRGYGKLVIIKHNKTYLSAYAHNQKLLVKEGDSVTKGQKIAEMGNSDSEQIKLHFEIRRFGKPVDPMKYLPAE